MAKFVTVIPGVRVGTRRVAGLQAVVFNRATFNAQYVYVAGKYFVLS